MPSVMSDIIFPFVMIFSFKWTTKNLILFGIFTCTEVSLSSHYALMLPYCDVGLCLVLVLVPSSGSFCSIPDVDGSESSFCLSISKRLYFSLNNKINGKHMKREINKAQFIHHVPEAKNSS